VSAGDTARRAAHILSEAADRAPEVRADDYVLALTLTGIGFAILAVREELASVDDALRNTVGGSR
jgi:hypothetical protein